VKQFCLNLCASPNHTLYALQQFIWRHILQEDGSLRGNIIRWFGIVLALAGLVAALVAWFSFNNLPFLIGDGGIALIGLIIFGYGTRSLPK
jgi:hypothetical protein